MPDTQKSEVCPEAPEQKETEMFCRDCADWFPVYTEIGGKRVSTCGYCRVSCGVVMSEEKNRCCFVRRPA